MTEGTEERTADPRVAALLVADEPDAWQAAGFAVTDGTVALGSVLVRLLGTDPERRGIVGWELSGVGLHGEHLDGLPTTIVDPAPAAPAAEHPNGVVGLDHVVVATPDLDRTLAALADAGLDLRRIRDTSLGGAPLRQAFFRLGPTVLEVIGGDGLAAGDGPSAFWGLAVDVSDLDATAAVLGAGLGRTKDAVQPGRRIATLRHRDLGLSVRIAAMDHLGPPRSSDR